MSSPGSVLPSPVVVVDDGGMSGSSPRAGGRSRRRSFSPAQKREHLVAYEDANSRGEGGAYLRGNGLYSSLISEWRRLRDAGMLDGKEPGVPVGRPTSEQAVSARLRRRAETDSTSPKPTAVGGSRSTPTQCATPPTSQSHHHPPEPDTDTSIGDKIKDTKPGTGSDTEPAPAWVSCAVVESDA